MSAPGSSGPELAWLWGPCGDRSPHCTPHTSPAGRGHPPAPLYPSTSPPRDTREDQTSGSRTNHFPFLYHLVCFSIRLFLSKRLQRDQDFSKPFPPFLLCTPCALCGDPPPPAAVWRLWTYSGFAIVSVNRSALPHRTVPSPHSYSTHIPPPHRGLEAQLQMLHQMRSEESVSLHCQAWQPGGRGELARASWGRA